MAKLILKPLPNFDLLPKNPRPLLIKIQDSKVNVLVEIETQQVSSAKTDRMTKVAAGVITQYRDVITDTVKKVTEGWDRMPLAEQRKSAETLNASIKKAMLSLEGAIEAAVKQQIQREAQGDKNLLEARVHVVIKGTAKVIAIGKDVAELAVSGGANVKAWISLASDIVALAKLIHDQCKKEPTLRAELLKAIGVYCSTKQRRWDEKTKAKDWKAKAKLLAKEVWESQKSLATKAEAARKKYRNEITVMIHKADDMGAKRDKLLSELNRSGDINAKSIAKGGAMMELARAAGTLNTQCLQCQDFVDDMAMLLTENGIQVDDRTALQKLQKLDNLGDLVALGKLIKTAADDLKTIIEKLA